MKRLIIILVAIGILLPGAAHADLGSMLVNDSGFADLSFKYLQDIFGIVDGVLHGSGTQIMGQMFGAFNSAVLTLGFIIMSYVFFVSTINTAHEGEVMGRDWSSIWIPLRIVGSTALIVPKASGYCAIQIFVMSVVVSGVIAADKVMNAALQYVLEGGVLIQSSPPPAADKVKVAGNILKSLTCMNGVYNIVLNDSVANNRPTPAKFMPTTVDLNNTSITVGNQTISFPSQDAQYNNSNYGGVCGNVTWPIFNKVNSTNYDGTAGTGYQDMRGVAVQQMILDLQSYAQTLADTLVPLKSANGTTTPGTQTVQDTVTANKLSLIFAAADYKGIMLPFYNERSGAFIQASKDKIKEMQNQGWIMLGSLYFNLAQLNNSSTNDDSDEVTATFKTNSTSSDAYKFLSQQPGFSNIYCESGCSSDAVISEADGSYTSGNYIDNNISVSAADPGAQDTYSASKSVNVNASLGGGVAAQVLSVVMNPLIGPIYTIISNMQALFKAESQNTDPIIAVSGLGSGLVSLVTVLWITVAMGILGVTVGVSVVPCVNPAGFGIIAFLSWFAPLFLALLLALFVSGAVMAFYVPLIPFILFTFAAIGWFAVVIEAMIAAPLVALGLASPEGHKLLGKAETSVLLLANVFLRPTLMVFGFFAGAILSHVGLWLLNKGYGLAWGWGVLSNLSNLGIFGALWALIAGLVIYMSLVLAVVNQTFGLIHQLPDELMRWLNSGHRALGSSPSDALGTVKGEFKGSMEGIGSGINSGMQGLQQYSSSAGKEAKDQADKKSTDTSTTFTNK